jgi:hypothetical protein
VSALIGTRSRLPGSVRYLQVRAATCRFAPLLAGPRSYLRDEAGTLRIVPDLAGTRCTPSGHRSRLFKNSAIAQPDINGNSPETTSGRNTTEHREYDSRTYRRIPFPPPPHRLNDLFKPNELWGTSGLYKILMFPLVAALAALGRNTTDSYRRVGDSLLQNLVMPQ